MAHMPNQQTRFLPNHSAFQSADATSHNQNLLKLNPANHQNSVSSEKPEEIVTAGAFLSCFKNYWR